MHIRLKQQFARWSVLVTLAAILVMLGPYSGSAQIENTVTINQSQSANGVEVKLLTVKEELEGLAIEYSYRASSGTATHLGSAAIVTSDGERVEGLKSSQIADEVWVDILPKSVLAGKTVNIDLGSFVVFDAVEGLSGTVSLGSDLAPVLDNALDKNSVLKLGATLTTADREYIVTELIVDRESPTKNFKLVIVPANESARLTELSAGRARVMLTDDRGNTYAWVGTRTRWARDTGRHEVAWQHLIFHGAPSPGASQLNLSVASVGKVVGPFVFQGIPLP